MHRLWTAPRRRGLGGAIFGLALVTAVIVAMPAGARPAAGGANEKDLWKHVPGTPAATKNGHKAQIKAGKLRAYTLDRGAAAEVLATAPSESPAIGGGDRLAAGARRRLQRFALERSPVMAPGSRRRIRRSRHTPARASTTRRRAIRADLTPQGFHASVRSAARRLVHRPVLPPGPEPLRELLRARLPTRNDAFVEREGDEEPRGRPRRRDRGRARRPVGHAAHVPPRAGHRPDLRDVLRRPRTSPPQR